MSPEMWTDLIGLAYYIVRWIGIVWLGAWVLRIAVALIWSSREDKKVGFRS